MLCGTKAFDGSLVAVGVPLWPLESGLISVLETHVKWVIDFMTEMYLL